MKKRFIRILLIIIIAIILTSCNKSVNEVLPKQLSEEQEEIVKLLSTDKQEILLFDYKIEEYKAIKLWIEIYKDGDLIDNLAGVEILNIEEEQLNGQFVITIKQSPSFEWACSIYLDEQVSASNTINYKLDVTEMARVYGAIDYPVSIEDGKEIVLYTSFFSDENISMNVDRQMYIEQPELLKDYDYAYIIKCKLDK